MLSLATKLQKISFAAKKTLWLQEITEASVISRSFIITFYHFEFEYTIDYITGWFLFLKASGRSCRASHSECGFSMMTRSSGC